jgi:hypothetical protein
VVCAPAMRALNGSLGAEDGGPWPASSVVQYHYGTVANANQIALTRAGPGAGP